MFGAGHETRSLPITRLGQLGPNTQFHFFEMQALSLERSRYKNWTFAFLGIEDAETGESMTLVVDVDGLQVFQSPNLIKREDLATYSSGTVANLSNKGTVGEEVKFTGRVLEGSQRTNFFLLPVKDCATTLRSRKPRTLN